MIYIIGAGFKPAPMSMMRLLVILVCIVLPGCNAGSIPSYERPFEIQGRLSSSTGLGGWGITTKAGQSYIPLHVPSEFQQEGLLVRAKAKLLKDSLLGGVELSDVRPASKTVDEWDRLFQTGRRDPTGPVEPVENFRRMSGLPLPFWPADMKQPGDEVVSFAWSGCGAVYVSFVKEIPDRANKRLEPELAFEFDEKGNVIRQWRLPGNTWPQAIQGNELLVRYDAYPILNYSSAENIGITVMLGITPDGKYRVLASDENSSEGSELECPAIEEFAGSAFTRCSVFRDRLSGENRRLAYQGPCT